MKTDIKRIIASLDGAAKGALIYVGSLILMKILTIDYYTLARPLQIITAPATLLIGLEPSARLWQGLPINFIWISLIIYVAGGYLIDWFIDPYE
jgi:hypothetical protein